MEKQKYVLKNIDSFELKDIFDCGQCFRWNVEEDGSYTGVFGNNVLNVKKENYDIIFEGICENDIKETVEDYFDLKRDYNAIKKELAKIDENMKISIEYGSGIRILNQDLWETIISFIISANNNIPRIKGIIERLSKKYGREMEFKDQKYYTFPTAKELKNVSVQEYRELGLGFRDIRLYESTNMILEGKIDLDKLSVELFRNDNTTNYYRQFINFKKLSSFII